jgi:AcrR family transcriptional regulator
LARDAEGPRGGSFFVETPDPSVAPGLRERKKAQIRRAIQHEALRLFLSKGYETTTVEEIAAAAGVSHMTFFRYFPRKEDVVLADEYDSLIVELLAARPAGEPAIETIRHALKEGLSRVYAADRDALLARTRLILSTPALRARLWEQQAATERLIAHALDDRPSRDRDDLRLRVVTSACLSAVTTAVVMWAESDGTDDLPDLIEQALTTLRRALCETDG